jgi:hypothetical protein
MCIKIRVETPSQFAQVLRTERVESVFNRLVQAELGIYPGEPGIRELGN